MRLVAFFIWLSLGLLACNTSPSPPLKEGQINAKLDVKAFWQKWQAEGKAKAGILLDVRTPQEVAAGALPECLNLDIYDDSFKQKVQELDRDKPVYIYCKSGGRSAQAASYLQGLGFKEVYDMAGGYDLWSRSQGQ